MSVQFNENNFAQTPQYGGSDETAGIPGKLISWGVAKDTKSANIILLSTFVILVIITGIFMTQIGGDDVVIELTPEEIFELERMGAQ